MRDDLAGEMIAALTSLPDEALETGAELHCAFYEFDDPEVIGHLDPLKGSLKLILSNMPGKDANGDKTDDTYAAQRQAIKDAGAEVHDRFTAGNHIAQTHSARTRSSSCAAR